MHFDELDWIAYREANMKFAEAVYAVCEPNDIVWVQDYHRMFMAKTSCFSSNRQYVNANSNSHAAA